MTQPRRLPLDDFLNAGMVPLLDELGFERRTARSRIYHLKKPDLHLWVKFTAKTGYVRGVRELTGVYFPTVQKLADELLDGEFDTAGDYPQPLCHCTATVTHRWGEELTRAHKDRERRSWLYRNWGERLPTTADEVCPYIDREGIWQIDWELPSLKGKLLDPMLPPETHADPATVGAFFAEKWRKYCLPWVRRALDMGPAFFFWDDLQSGYSQSPLFFEPRLTVEGLLTRALFYHAIGDRTGRDRNIKMAFRPSRWDHIERDIQTVLSGEKSLDDLTDHRVDAKWRLQAIRLGEAFGVSRDC